MQGCLVTSPAARRRHRRAAPMTWRRAGTLRAPRAGSARPGSTSRERRPEEAESSDRFETVAAGHQLPASATSDSRVLPTLPCISMKRVTRFLRNTPQNTMLSEYTDTKLHRYKKQKRQVWNTSQNTMLSEYTDTKLHRYKKTRKRCKFKPKQKRQV